MHKIQRPLLVRSHHRRAHKTHCGFMAYKPAPATTAAGGGGEVSSFWMSGAGLATDATGNLFFVTGNGIFDVDTGGRGYG